MCVIPAVASRSPTAGLGLAQRCECAIGVRIVRITLGAALAVANDKQLHRVYIPIYYALIKTLCLLLYGRLPLPQKMFYGIHMEA
jgi:hypothetical protein